MPHTLESIAAWRRLRLPDDITPYHAAALAIFEEMRARPALDGPALNAILRRHPRDGRHVFSKNLLVRLYRELCARGDLAPDAELERRLRMKPVRTLSGVATVTVLTRPHPCPGDCLFCPTDPSMPKSYLPDEPGAQRAAQHDFDPHAQVAARLSALDSNGHPTDKIELLVLGGTWSSYPRTYQEWFVHRCLDAMNGRDAPTLAEAQAWNATAAHRNVGLVVELRPDEVNAVRIRRLRAFGVTKVQIGVQSLDDRVLALNRRGHDAATTRRALTLLRAAGLKLVVHWMPNLLGATPAGDLADFARLWSDPALRPDELKIYPCVLLRGTPLHDAWRQGRYTPYDDATLVELVAAAKTQVPPWCRINRIYRDIPTHHVVAGCRLSNLRQEAQRHLADAGGRCRCIRCREVRDRQLEPGALTLGVRRYATAAGEEHFIAFETAVPAAETTVAEEDRPASAQTAGETRPTGDPPDQLAGYARLWLPDRPIPLGMPELAGAALVRELHIYGRALPIGDRSHGEAQHRGLGTRLLAAAEELAARRGHRRVAVIASVGTRRYYADRGYRLEGTYMVKSLAPRAAGRGPASRMEGADR
ncbi:MAG: tRNA uridine(34) 5-carboxymethylaminomethyl modification radical SAM/GNAT enzyme Elp3 [Candidatus Eiseniibacteriota bacterium]